MSSPFDPPPPSSMHTPPPLPFNPNAHHFNSAMNNVGFGFGGAGSRAVPQQQQQQGTGFEGGFASFGSAVQGSGSVGSAGAGTGFGFGFGGRPNPAASTSSSTTTSFAQQYAGPPQTPQTPNQPRPNLFQHATTPNLNVTPGSAFGEPSSSSSLNKPAIAQPSNTNTNVDINSHTNNMVASSRRKRTRSISPDSPRMTTSNVTSGSGLRAGGSSRTIAGKRTRESASPTKRSTVTLGASRSHPADDDEDDKHPQHAELSDVQGSTRKKLRRDEAGKSRDRAGGRSLSRKRDDGRVVGQDGELVEGDEDQGDEEDVGVLLASIPTSSLLPLIHSLLQHRPALTPLLKDLMPTPEIDDVLSVLKDRARAVVVSVPLGEADDGLVGLRVRGGLGEFCKAAMTYLPRFIIEEPKTDFRTGSTNTTTNNGNNTTARNINNMNNGKTTRTMTPMTNTTTVTTPRRAPVHPTIPPTLLVPLSQTILGTIFPALPPRLPVQGNTSFDQLEALCDKVLRGWTTWVKVLGKTVNEEGGMFSIGVVKGWENGMDELVTYHLQRTQALEAQTRQQQRPATDDQTKANMKGTREGMTIAKLEKRFGDGLKRVRDEWVDSVGWMVGRSRPVEGFEGAAGEDVRMG